MPVQQQQQQTYAVKDTHMQPSGCAFIVTGLECFASACLLSLVMYIRHVVTDWRPSALALSPFVPQRSSADQAAVRSPVAVRPSVERPSAFDARHATPLHSAESELYCVPFIALAERRLLREEAVGERGARLDAPVLFAVERVQLV